MTRRSLRLIALLGALLVRPTAGFASEPLPKDPNNIYGKLDNGFAYIIRKHANPPDRIVFFLHVKTGALNESDSQNGLAHFLEHMSFNGSKHFAPGELIPYMNKLGMKFGADSNAHTNYQETVYKLFMPDVKQETIDKALTILSDFAGELLLSPKEIDNERQVILEEARSHKSAGERIQKQWMRKVFSGTRLATHDVIGDEKQIEKFPKAEFDDYWNAWYRPEKMTLIVVGDADPQAIEKEIKKYFETLKARAPDRKPIPTGIAPVNKTRAFVFTDPEQVMTQVQLVAITPARPPLKTYDDYRFNEMENIGTWIVDRRLREMVDKGSAAFRGASVYVSGMMNEAILPMGVAFGEPTDWNKMLEQVIVEISRAVEHGFSEQEFELAKQEMRADAERDVEREPTLDARVFVNQYSNAMGEDLPILSAKQRLDLLKRILSEATLDEVHQIFVKDFKDKAYTYTVLMPEKTEGLKRPTSDEVLAAAKEAWAKKTDAIKKKKSADSLLAALPTPGKVVKQSTDDELKITTARLSNGVIVNHRFMDYKKDEVHIHIALPGGSIEESAENRGVSEAAEIAFDRPATSRLDSTQIEDLMTGKKVRVGGNIGVDDLTISVSGSPKDMETGMQLAYALLTDAKIEQAAFDNWKKLQLQRIEMMKTMVEGRLREAMGKVVYGGDIRLCPLTVDEVNKLSVEKAESWLKHITEKAAMEVTIVGEISLEDALALATKYLGSLPERSSDFAALDSLRKLHRGKGPYEEKVEFKTVTPKAIVLAGFVGCEERNSLDRRLLTLGARILSDRMIKRIREEERLVYGIGCQNQPSRAMKGMGMVFAAAPTDPHNADKLADTILEMMKEFAEKGPTDEEVDIAKKQISNELDKQLKEPGFWLGQLSEMQYRNRPLSELKELPGIYMTFSGKMIQDAFHRYLKDNELIRLVIVPDAESQAKAAGKEDGQPSARPQRGRKPGKDAEKEPAGSR